MKETWNLFHKALEEVGVRGVAQELGIHVGTVKRWLELESVPPQYWFDFARILCINVDYEDFTPKEKDQFFTNASTAANCYGTMLNVLAQHGIDTTKYTYIEPAAGCGSFFELLPKDRRIGIDIEPMVEGVIKHDFLTWEAPYGDYITIGNPPFGLRGHLALKFINRAAQFSDFVAFIVPQLFASNGKGSCKSRVRGMNLIHNEIIDTSFFYPDGTNVEVNVVFQIWAKHISSTEVSYDLSDRMRVLSLSDGGTSGSTRNKAMLDKCDYYLPSTVFGSSAIKLYDSFEDLPGRRGYGIITDDPELRTIIEQTDWSAVAFASTNGAANLRTDLIVTTSAHWRPSGRFAAVCPFAIFLWMSTMYSCLGSESINCFASWVALSTTVLTLYPCTLLSTAMSLTLLVRTLVPLAMQVQPCAK